MVGSEIREQVKKIRRRDCRQGRESMSNTATKSSSSSVTFDAISKLFSFPLSDAASNLGVCSSVLKKVCRENGLVRWPYRQFLSGKSVDEIKKEAARERSKQLSELSKASGRTSLAPTGSAISSTFQHQNTSSGSNIFKSGDGTTQTTHYSNRKPTVTVKKIPTLADEFKYGFPSTGLSTINNKWWGDGNHEGNDEGESKEGMDDDKQTDKLSDEGKHITLVGSVQLINARKRAVGEGQEVLKRRRTLVF